MQKRDSENIANAATPPITDALPLKKRRSSELSKTDVALAAWGQLLSEWGAGKFNDPEVAGAAIDEFFTKDCVIDATNGIAGLHPKFKVYTYATVQDYFAMLADFDFEGMKANFVANPHTEGEVWHHAETAVTTHKITGKKVQNASGLCIVTFAGAKVSKLVLINRAASALAAMYNADQDVPVQQPVAMPSFEPAADPMPIFQAIFASWGAGEFNNADTKQATLEKFIVPNCVLDHSSPAMPSLLKAYTGHTGVEEWNIGVVSELWEMSNLDVAATAGITPGCVLMKMAFDVKHKKTGKEAKGVISYQEFAYNTEGKFVYSKTYWADPVAIAAIHADL